MWSGRATAVGPMVATVPFMVTRGADKSPYPRRQCAGGVLDVFNLLL
jgi:hypothetical protein